MNKIPNSYKVGGQIIVVEEVERLDNNRLGESCLSKGTISIAQKYNKADEIPETVRLNTFYHELTHSILDTMGYHELSADEKFVSCFSSFLTEAMTSLSY